MCNFIHIYYLHCHHKEYSNTWLCGFARGVVEDDHFDYTLARTKFLPERKKKDLLEQINERLSPDSAPPPVPPKNWCTKRCPIRPVNAMCRACKRDEAQRKAGVVKNATENREYDCL